MDRSLSPPLAHDATLSSLTTQFYWLSNLLHVAATAISFFLVYYFVTALHFSMVEAGLLMSFYGLGIFFATVIGPYLKQSKIVLGTLLLSTLTLGNFLMLRTFSPLALNLMAFGFASALFKNTPWPSSPKLYLSSNLGLALTMLLVLLFSLQDFKVLCVIALIFNALALLFVASGLKQNKIIQKEVKHKNTDLMPCLFPKKDAILCFLLLFLGGLLLAQLTITYGLYLALEFPHLGLKALAIFMLIHLSVLCFLQKPLLMVFYRGNALFKSGCGAFLLGLGCYVLCFGHAFSVVGLSAMVFSLGEVFFINALYKTYREANLLNFFSKVLTLSLILGASSGTYVFQYAGADRLWHACALLGMLCLGVGLFSFKIQLRTNRFKVFRRARKRV